MALEKHRVRSGMCTYIGYDDATGEMHVYYPSGKESIYGAEDDPVPRNVFEACLSADSVGSMIHALVINQYPHRYP